MIEPWAPDVGSVFDVLVKYSRRARPVGGIVSYTSLVQCPSYHTFSRCQAPRTNFRDWLPGASPWTREHVRMRREEMRKC